VIIVKNNLLEIVSFLFDKKDIDVLLSSTSVQKKGALQ
jgi:hypothetical protein